MEVLVVDDGSTDGSAAIARRYSWARYCYQPNRGAASARNRGLASAQGEWFAFLDADDVWATEKLAQQMKALKEDPEAAAALGYAEEFYSPELADRLRGRVRCLAAPLPAYHQKRVAHSARGFFPRGSVQYQLEARRDGGMVCQSEAGGLEDAHAAGSGLSPQSAWRQPELDPKPPSQDYARILKAALDYQRQQQAAWNRSAAP